MLGCKRVLMLRLIVMINKVFKYIVGIYKYICIFGYFLCYLVIKCLKIYNLLFYEMV